MVRGSIFNFGFLSLACTLALAASCGGKVVIDSESSDDGQGGGTPLPPTPPAACTSGSEIVLAMDHIFLGDTDRDGAPNPTNGWKQYGFDIDQLVSTKESTNLCKPKLGAPPVVVYPDGAEGRDNSFGKNVLPIVLGLDAYATIGTNDAILKGQLTHLVQIDEFEPVSTCSTPLRVFLGAPLGKPPLWNGSDVWSIDPSSLTNAADPKSAKWSVEDGVVENATVSGRSGGTIDLLVIFSGGLPLRLHVHDARISFVVELGSSLTVTRGDIGGVLDPEELVSDLVQLAGTFDPSLCDPSSPTMASITNQIRQASDILLDGKQDPNKECNGISIGVGFTMKLASLGGVAKPSPPVPNPCP